MSKLLTASLLASAAIVSAAPNNVVFGNLGNYGTDTFDATGTNITSTVSLGVAFKVSAAADYYLQSITIGAYAQTTGNYVLSLYTGSNSSPDITNLVATSSLSMAGNSSSLNVFSFSNVTLSKDSIYWVLPAQGIYWQASTDFVSADGLNSSGFSLVSNRRNNNGGGWANYGVPYSISVSATSSPVPEPSTYGIALGGLALVGAIVRRRKQAK